MTTLLKKLRFCLRSAAVLSLSAAAFAEQKCFTATIDTTPTTWERTMEVPLFDPNLGILKSVRFELSGEETGSAAVENRDVRGARTTCRFGGRVVLQRPDGSEIVVTLPQVEFLDVLGAYDGVDDFAGNSGTTHMRIGVEQTEIVTLTSAADLALFTGPPGEPGTLGLPTIATGTAYVMGSGNLLARFAQSASATVSVCYTYRLDCNHNGVPDVRDILYGNTPDLNFNGIPDECDPLIEPHCFGDGPVNGGPDCPCSNNTLQTSQAGCLNSSGQGGRLTATGVPSISNDTLVLTLSGLPGATHPSFVQGTEQANGGMGVPYGDGLWCLGGTIINLAKIPPGGPMTLPRPNGPTISQMLGLQVGSTRYFQGRFRNSAGPCGYGFSTTNAIRIVYGY